MQKRGEAVKKVIVEAASQLFREDGFRAASVDTIARRAGVSKATVYSHFKNKEGLFKATVTDFVTPILARLPEPKPVEDVRTELIKFAEAISQVLMTPEKVEWDRMMVGTAKKFPELARDYFEAGPQQAFGRVAEFLKAQEKAGTLTVPDPDFSAEMLCGMLFGSRLMRNLIAAQPSPPDRIRLHKTVDAFLKVHSS